MRLKVGETSVLEAMWQVWQGLLSACEEYRKEGVKTGMDLNSASSVEPPGLVKGLQSMKTQWENY